MIEFRSRTAPPPYGWKPFVPYSLDHFFILSIHHDFLDHFCSCIATLAIIFCEASVTGFPVLSSTPTGTQLQAFVWRNNGSGPRSLACASLGFYSPEILETRIPPSTNMMLHPKISNSQMLDFSEPEPVNHPDCCSGVRLNRHVATHAEVIQNRLQSHHICRGSHHLCQFGLSTAQGQDSHSFGPRLHQLTTPHRDTSHCGFSCGVASRKSLRRQIPQYRCPTQSMHISRSFAGI